MSKHLNDREITVYISLWENGHTTLQSVADDTELPLMAVSRAVKELERVGAITCERVNGRILAHTIECIEPEELVRLLPCGRLLSLA